MNTLINPALKTVKLSRFNEHYFPAINQYQFEKLDSVSLFRQRFPQFTLTNTLHIVIGLDSGLLANYVMEMDLPKGSKFIFVELEEVTQVLNIDIPHSQQDDIYICNYNELATLLESPILQIYFQQFYCRVSDSLGAAAGHLEGYLGLKSMIQTTLKMASMRLTNILSMQKFMTKQLDNAADNQVSAMSVLSEYDFSTMTCIVVAGGPSVDRQIEWIKSNQKQLFIIAISRVAGKLVEAGIIPHMVMTIDPLPLSLSVSRGLLPLADRILLVNSHHAASEIIGQWSGLKCYLGQQLPWSDEQNFDTDGPTVTNTAINVAIALQFKHILFSGVDLCFSPDGHTHASGSLESEINPAMLGHIGQWVETNDGQLAETTIQMYSALEVMQSKIAEVDGIEFINLAAQAAKIDKVNFKDPSDVVLGLPVIDSGLFFAELTQKFSSYDTKQQLQNTRNEINTFKDKLLKVQKLIEQTLPLCQQLGLSQNDPKQVNKLNKQLSRIELKINNSGSGLIKLIKTFGYLQFMSFLSVQKIGLLTTDQQTEQTHAYYKSFNAAISQLLKVVCSSLARVECRLNELNPEVPLAKLACRWRKDDQTGRYLIWLKTHQNAQKTSIANTGLINELIKEYSLASTTPDKPYENYVKSRSNLKPVKTKIEILKNERHLAGISQMVRSLMLYKDKSDEATALYWLALSVKSELEGDLVKAKENILNIPKEQRGITELKQLISTALQTQDLESAILGFEEIAQFTDAHTIKYAQVLKLQGKVQEAVNLYLDYLEKYPEDVVTWVGLGVYMFDIQQFDAAKTAFINALGVEPDNELAKQYMLKLTA